MAKRPQPKKQTVTADVYRESLNQQQILRLALENISGQLQRAQGQAAQFRAMLAGIMLQEGLTVVELRADIFEELDAGAVTGIEWEPVAEAEGNLKLSLVLAVEAEAVDAAD